MGSYGVTTRFYSHVANFLHVNGRSLNSIDTDGSVGLVAVTAEPSNGVGVVTGVGALPLVDALVRGCALLDKVDGAVIRILLDEV